MLRSLAAAAALACALAGTAAAGVASECRAGAPADALEHDVLAEVNAFRARHGLTPLRLSARLVAAAESHATAMARRGFFAHRSADGTSVPRRVRRFYAKRGFARWSVGENLLWSARTLDGRRALRMWLRSRTHRRNLLTPRWREIGLAALRVDGAPGVFAGRDVTIVTANFGHRR